MARLEIEIGAINTELKKVLNDSRKQLRDFQKEVGKSSISLGGSFGVNPEDSKRLTDVAIKTEDAKRRLAELNLEKRKGVTVTTAANGSYREAQQRLTALGKSIREAENGFRSTSPAIKTQIQEYAQLNSQLKSFDKTLGNNYRNVGNYGSAFQGVGSAASILSPQLGLLSSSGAGFIGVALAAKNAYDVVSTFDSGLRNVEKTTGLTTKETNELGKSFVDLSKSLKIVSSNDLTQYATIAGQLGVKGTKDILAFTEALAKLEIASNISGEDGGAEIARTLTLVDGGVQNVKAFADEIVNLGNNFAATEKEILGNAESIAQNVGIYKIGRQDVLAFATATKSVGIEAELVGSTFNRTLAIFEKSIRTGDGLKTILSLIGGTQASLSKRFKEDASGVFVDFVGALNKVYKSGGSVNKELEAIGVNAVRDQRVIQSLAANGFDVLTRALDTARGATGALDKEFATASTKITNDVARIKVSWENLLLSIEEGTGVIGTVSSAFATATANIIDGFTAIVTSKSYKDFFASLASLGGSTFSANSFIGQTNSNALKAVLGGDSYTKVSDFDRAVGRNVKGFDSLSRLDQEKKITEQIAIVQRQAADYNANKNQESFERLKFQNSILSEIYKKYYTLHDKPLADQKVVGGLTAGQLELTKAQAREAERLAKELAKTKNALDLAGLSEYDRKVAEVRQKFEEIRLIVKDSDSYLAKATENIAAELNKLNNARFIDSVSGVRASRAQRPTPSFSDIPDIGKLLSSNAGFQASILKGFQTEELSKRIKNQIGRTFFNTIDDIVGNIASIGEKGAEIELKYAELREGKNADQIAQLNKIMALEKSIATGFGTIISSLFDNISKGISGILQSQLTEQIGDVFDGKVSFSDFASKNKTELYALGASLAGSLVSGITSKTSAIGQGLGGALSGAGTGAAIGSIIPGVGTAIGAVAGGLIGAISGIFGASNAKKQQQIQEAQLAEQRKQTAIQQRMAALTYASSIVGQYSNQGLVTGVERNEFGELKFKLEGNDLYASMQRTQQEKERGL